MSATLATVPAATASEPSVHVSFGSGTTYQSDDIVLTGSASDDTGVTSVEYGVRLANTNLWWRGTRRGFVDGFERGQASITRHHDGFVEWRVDLRGIPNGRYRLWVRATDEDGNRTVLRPWPMFRVRGNAKLTPFWDRESTDATVETDFTRIALHGSAIDDRSVTKVFVGLKDRDSDRWLQADGTFESRVTKFEAELGSPGARATIWTREFAVPDGRFRVSVRAIDDEGREVSLVPRPLLQVDTTGPEITPAFEFGATLGGPRVALGGDLIDVGKGGIGSTLASVEDRATGHWLQSDGSFGPDRFEFSVGPNNSDHYIASFCLSAMLPDGEYALAMRAWDFRGWPSTLAPSRHFTVDSDAQSFPHLALDPFRSPFVESRVLFSGEAFDDLGVVAVFVAIRDRDTGLWYSPTRWLPDMVKRGAQLSDEGAEETDWAYEATLPDGRYLLSVRAKDQHGCAWSLSPWVQFEVDTAGPVISTQWEDGQVLGGPEVRLNGRLTDALSEALAAFVSIRDGAGLWLQGDGTLGPDFAEHAALVLNKGDERDLAWRFAASLPEGEYSMSMRATDVLGNESSLEAPVRFAVDHAIDPVPVPMADLDADTVLTTTAVELTGSAADDWGVVAVDIGIRDRDTGLWWTPRGFVSWVQKHPATLATPSHATTDWSFALDLPDGRYSLSVRAFDVQGYSQSISPWISFEVDTS